MNRNIIIFSSVLGTVLSLGLLAFGVVPDWVGAGYMAICAVPVLID